MATLIMVGHSFRDSTLGRTKTTTHPSALDLRSYGIGACRTRARSGELPRAAGELFEVAADGE